MFEKAVLDLLYALVIRFYVDPNNPAPALAWKRAKATYEEASKEAH